MKKDGTQLIIRGHEITLHFCHIKEQNSIPENVERMLLGIGLPPYTPPEEAAEQST